MRVYVWLLILGVAAASTWADVIFVNQSNTSGTEDGAAWTTAYATLQPAADAAAPGDELWVAAGHYNELRNALDGALTLREGIALYGGFSGSETERGQRDAAVNTTIIDGATSRLNAPAHHVLVAAQGVLIDGFTIRGGKATAGGVSGNYGGGMLAIGVDVALLRCIFESNEAVLGGAIAHRSGGNLEIRNSIFRNNIASSYGGAVFDEGGSSYTACVFETNNALMGGAVTLYEGPLAVNGCVFESNRALARDGGAFWVSFNGTADLEACQFTGNIAETDGGALANWGGEVNLRNTILRNNRATRAGGAIFTLDAVNTVHCTVWKNSAKVDSAAVVSSGGRFVALNADFRGNTPASILNLSAFQANVTYSNVEGGFSGEGNINEDSKYRDPDNGDFRLFPSSPLINAGREVEGVTSDYRGAPRPSGLGFDIGAAEFFDSDEDLMEDDWEDEFGFDPADPEDGGSDADGDGLTNAREFELNTNPLDTTEPPREFYIEKSGDDRNSGTLEAPFETVGRALAAANFFGNTLALHAGPGLFEEQIDLPPGIVLRGAGAAATEFRHYNAADARHVVVELGNGSRIEDCRVALPPLQAGLGVLVSMRNASGALERVVLDGGDSLFSIGISAQGAASSNSLVVNCRIRRVQVGIQTLDSEITISRNTFEGIRGDAVLVNLPDSKQSTGARVPLLGRDGVSGTGGNVFGSVVGHFVVNLTSTTVSAENNDWGASDPEAIASKMFGPVDFEPYEGEKALRFLGCGAEPAGKSSGGDALILLLLTLVLLTGTRKQRPHQR